MFIIIIIYQITIRNIINRYQHFVLPVHLPALHAHQSRSGLLAGAEGRGSKIDNHEIHRETWRIYLAAQRGSNSCPISLHHHKNPPCWPPPPTNVCTLWRLTYESKYIICIMFITPKSAIIR